MNLEKTKAISHTEKNKISIKDTSFRVGEVSLKKTQVSGVEERRE